MSSVVSSGMARMRWATWVAWRACRPGARMAWRMHRARRRARRSAEPRCAQRIARTRRGGRHTHAQIAMRTHLQNGVRSSVHGLRKMIVRDHLLPRAGLHGRDGAQRCAQLGEEEGIR